jgi:hypothetical protein
VLYEGPLEPESGADVNHAKGPLGRLSVATSGERTGILESGGCLDVAAGTEIVAE